VGKKEMRFPATHEDEITLSTLWIFVKDYAALMERDCWSFHPKKKKIVEVCPIVAN
jgi:hypothetical protein